MNSAPYSWHPRHRSEGPNPSLAHAAKPLPSSPKVPSVTYRLKAPVLFVLSYATTFTLTDSHTTTAPRFRYAWESEGGTPLSLVNARGVYRHAFPSRPAAIRAAKSAGFTVYCRSERKL